MHEEDQIDKKCTICDFEGENVNMIEKHTSYEHVDQVNKGICEECQFSAYHGPILEAHKLIHKGNCELCTFRGASKRELRLHTTSKHGRQKLQCSMCNFSTTSNPHMKKHSKEIHGTPYDHVCDLCGRDYPTKSYLESHKIVHSDVKGVKCNLCIFETKQISSIRIHWKYVHSDVKIELKCQLCDFEAPNLYDLKAKFKHEHSQLAVLEAHLKEEHKNTAERRVCSDCQFSAYHEGTLDTHIKSIHRELNCQQCNFEGASLKHLRIHMTVMHGQGRSKPHKSGKHE